MEIDITELTDIEPDSVHLVGKGANGFPALLAKAAKDAADGKVDCPTCDGSGKIKDGNVDCPDCDATGKVTQAQADKLGKATIDTDDGYGDLVKAKYNADELKAMADKGQAMTNEAGDPSYPIADQDDLEKAIKAVGRGNANHDTIRKHIIARAAALKLSKLIPDDWNADGSIAATAKAAGDTVPADDGIPGSKSWEAADAARLNEATQALLDLQTLIQTAAEREQIEGQTVDPSDMAQAWSLQDATYMLQNLLGCIAAMAVIEQRESDNAEVGTDEAAKAEAAVKAGKRLSTKTIAALAAARDHLTATLGDDDPAKTDDTKKGALVLTTEELDDILAAHDARIAAKSTQTDTAKPEGESVDDTEDTVTKTVNEVTDLVKGLEASIDASLTEVKDRLATVEKMAAPGGPAKTRTPAALAKADGRDALDMKAAEFEHRADVTTDPELRRGYLAKAREVRDLINAA